MSRQTVPVSIVIPCFHACQTIERAVNSVFNQTVLPKELILVDDGSNDGTVEHLHCIAATRPAGQVKVLALPRNVGVASARNAGWQAASGDYIAFLDADDAWHPSKLDFQYQFMEANPHVALSGHDYAVKDPESTWRVPGDPASEGLPDPIGRHRILLGNVFVTPSVMLRRELPHRFQEGRRHFEDHLLWMEIALAGHRVVKLSACLAFLFKKPYGASGLSANLFAMEHGELMNYVHLYRNRMINAAELVAIVGWSLAKFVRRLGIATIWRIRQHLGGAT